MLEMPFIIHVTWGLGKVGNYRKMKEMQSLGRRGIHRILFFLWDGERVRPVILLGRT